MTTNEGTQQDPAIVLPGSSLGGHTVLPSHHILLKVPLSPFEPHTPIPSKYSSFIFIYLSFISPRCVYACASDSLHVVRKTLVLYFHHVGSADWTQVFKLGTKSFYRLSHLGGPLLAHCPLSLSESLFSGLLLSSLCVRGWVSLTDLSLFILGSFLEDQSLKKGCVCVRN